LEIADYERSIKSLNIQLISKEKEIGDLRLELASSNEKVSRLTSELDKMEKERDDEREKSTKLKQLLVKAKKDVSDAKAQEAEHASQDATTQAQLQRFNLEIENLKLQIVEITTEREKLRDKMHLDDEMHQRSIQLLDSKLRASDLELGDSKAKLTSLNQEYESYKLKVQHAFKKQKELTEVATVTSSTSNEMQLKFTSEIETLNDLLKKSNEKCERAGEKLSLLERENESLQEEYGKSLERNTRLLADMREKETHWELKYQELNKTSAARCDETAESVRSLQTEKELLQNTHREKLRQLNAQHCQSIDLLQSQLIESKNEIEKLSKQIEELKLNATIDMKQHQQQQQQQSFVNSAVNLFVKIDDNQKSEVSWTEINEKTRFIKFDHLKIIKFNY
jgi:chromosome segregation ATPase